MNEIIFDTIDNMPEGAIDITPDNSDCPVFSIPMSEEMKQTMIIEKQRLIDEKNEKKRQEQIRQSALTKLAALGLTEEEAKSVIGI